MFLLRHVAVGGGIALYLLLERYASVQENAGGGLGKSVAARSYWATGIEREPGQTAASLRGHLNALALDGSKPTPLGFCIP